MLKQIGKMTMMISLISNFLFCPIKKFLGIPCPGCGMTRAFLHLFQGDFSEAFFYHPLFWLVPIILFVMLLRKRSNFCAKLAKNTYFVWGNLSLVIGVYVVRLFWLFPTTAPMDFDQTGALPSIYHIMFG